MKNFISKGKIHRCGFSVLFLVRTFSSFEEIADDIKSKSDTDAITTSNFYHYTTLSSISTNFILKRNYPLYPSHFTPFPIVPDRNALYKDEWREMGENLYNNDDDDNNNVGVKCTLSQFALTLFHIGKGRKRKGNGRKE